MTWGQRSEVRTAADPPHPESVWIFLDESEPRGMTGMSEGERWKTSSFQVLISSQTAIVPQSRPISCRPWRSGVADWSELSVRLCWDQKIQIQFMDEETEVKWSEVGQWSDKGGGGGDECRLLYEEREGGRERDIHVTQWMKYDGRDKEREREREYNNLFSLLAEYSVV